MKPNINVIKSVWRRCRKPSRASMAAICSQNPQNYPAYEAGRETTRKAHTVDSAVRQHVARLEADRHDLLTMAKSVVRLRDMNVHPRPSSEMIHALRDTIATVERRTTETTLWRLHRRGCNSGGDGAGRSGVGCRNMTTAAELPRHRSSRNYILRRQEAGQVQGTPTSRLISSKREIDIYRNGLMFEGDNVVGVRPRR
jgi:hypothetical protein